MENVDSITLNLGSTQLMCITFHTPTLQSTKLDDTTTPKNIKEDLEDLYRLAITPAYLCNGAIRLQLTLIKDITHHKAQHHTI